MTADAARCRATNRHGDRARPVDGAPLPRPGLLVSPITFGLPRNYYPIGSHPCVGQNAPILRNYSLVGLRFITETEGHYPRRMLNRVLRSTAP